MADIASRGGKSAFSRYSEPSSPVRSTSGLNKNGKQSTSKESNFLSALRGLANKTSNEDDASPLQVLSNSAAASPVLRTGNSSDHQQQRTCTISLLKQLNTPSKESMVSSPEGDLDRNAPWRRLSVDTNGGILKTGTSRPQNTHLNEPPSTTMSSGASTVEPGSAAARASAIKSKPTQQGENANSDTKFRGAWTAAEDEQLIEIVRNRGPNGWTAIATELDTGRNGRQCRERWSNQINPNLKRTGWTDEEDEMILKLHKEVGNRWATIAKQLAGRTDNMVKNRFNGSLLPRTTRPESQRKLVSTSKKSKQGQSRGKASTSIVGTEENEEELLMQSSGKKRKSRSAKSGGGNDEDADLTPRTKEVKPNGCGSKKKSTAKGGKRKPAAARSVGKKTGIVYEDVLDNGNDSRHSTDSLLATDSMYRLTTAAAAVEMLGSGSASHGSKSSTPNLDSLQMVASSLSMARGMLDFSSPAVANSPIKRNFIPNSGTSTSTTGLRGLGAFSDLISGRSTSALCFSAESSPNKRDSSSPFLPLQLTPNRFSDMLGTVGSTGDCTPAAVRNLAENFSTGMVDQELASASAKKRCRAAAHADNQTPMSLVGSECGAIGGASGGKNVLTRSSSRRSRHGSAAMARPESPTQDVEGDAAAAVIAKASSISAFSKLLKTPGSVTKGNSSNSNTSSNDADEPMMGTTPSKMPPSANMTSPSIVSMLNHLKNNLGSAQKVSRRGTPGLSSFQDLELDSNRKLQALVSATTGAGAGQQTNKGHNMEIDTDVHTQSGFGGEQQLLSPSTAANAPQGAMAVLSEVAVNSLPKEVAEGAAPNSLLSAPGTGGAGLLPSTSSLLSSMSDSNSNMSSQALLHRLLNPGGSSISSASSLSSTALVEQQLAVQTTPTIKRVKNEASSSIKRSNRSRRARSKLSPSSTPSARSANGSIVTPQQQPKKRGSAKETWAISDKPCTCRKSKCLKLYCACFSTALHCGPGCECSGCSNIPGSDLWKVAIESQPQVDGSPRDAGCRCRNSMCLKKYCDCYRNGHECNSRCSCEQCHNTPQKDKSSVRKEKTKYNSKGRDEDL